jgi:hypothetical protein
MHARATPAQDVVKRQVQVKLAFDVSLLDQKLLEQISTYYRLVSLWLVRSADPDNKGYAGLLCPNIIFVFAWRPRLKGCVR